MLRVGILIIICLGVGNLKAQTQLELNEAEAKNYQLKDAELNKVYKKLVTMLKSKDKQLLLKSQRAWIAFRDSHCAFAASSYEGGSMQPSVHMGCLSELTEKRIIELKALIEDRSPK